MYCPHHATMVIFNLNWRIVFCVYPILSLFTSTVAHPWIQTLQETPVNTRGFHIISVSQHISTISVITNIFGLDVFMILLIWFVSNLA